jgi:uncharacterized protein (DUF433 family)
VRFFDLAQNKGFICFCAYANLKTMENYQALISINSQVRFGKPCVRDTRISVGDVLGWLAAGMSVEAILIDFPQLKQADIFGCLSYAASREQHSIKITLAA